VKKKLFLFIGGVLCVVMFSFISLAYAWGVSTPWVTDDYAPHNEVMISASGNQDGTQVYIDSSAAVIGFSFYGWGIGIPTFAATDLWMQFLGYNSQNQLVYVYGPYHESGCWLWMKQWGHSASLVDSIM
jgi:hypothetical protein